MTQTKANRIALVSALLNQAAAFTGLQASKIHSLESTNRCDRPIIRARVAIMVILREEYGWPPPIIAKAFNCMESLAYNNTKPGNKTRKQPEFQIIHSHLKKLIFK